jgi:hypothetical protein
MSNPVQSRLQHIYHGQPYARVDLNTYSRVDFILQSGTLDLASDHRHGGLFGNVHYLCLLSSVLPGVPVLLAVLPLPG